MKTGIFYSFNSGSTLNVAGKIIKAFGENNIDANNIEEIGADKFLSYDRIILGASTWFDGELPGYWDEFLPELENANLTGKKIAFFGLGNQKAYPENFGDALGIFYQLFKAKGADIVGFTYQKAFNFENSKALIDDKFCGLLIDEDTQSELTDERVNNWVKQLEKEF